MKIGENQNITSKLKFIIGSVIFLLLLVLIIQYNNFFYTKKVLDYNSLVNKMLIMPERFSNLQHRFVTNDLLNDQILSSNQGTSIDTLSAQLSNYIQVIDSILKSNYLTLNKESKVKLRGIIDNCNSLKIKYNLLKEEILERGLYSSGKSGEWQRYGSYLQELSMTYHNPDLIREVSALPKQQIEYQISKNSQHMTGILEHINYLKLSLISKKPVLIKGLGESDQLKFINELETFSSLTQALYKLDTKLGICGSQGFLGDINLQLGLIQDHSNEGYQLINKSLSQTFVTSFLIKLFIIIFLAIIYYIFLHNFSVVITNSVRKIKSFSSELVQGKLPGTVELTAGPELAEAGELLNNFVISLREKIRFAVNLGTGKHDINLIPLSDEDTLANALLNMEKSLDKAAEEDKKYKIEEQKRAWSNEGLAKFSEILRMRTDNLARLSDEIISQLVRYLGANQGGIFLYNDENYSDVFLELISAFAYDRKKYAKKRIELGEGLIGMCAQEKQTIFLTDIPDHYIEITSGLGDAPPKCLLITPMKTEEALFGIVELASFTVFQPHEIEFVEKIAQSIASTFASIKISINTSRLLEQSKKQAEEMTQQEEEMRQNLEELQSTQEESARREAEINSLIRAVDISSLVIQCDVEGRIIEVNAKFATMLKFRRDELISRTLKSVFSFDHDKDEFYNLLTMIKQGQSVVRNEEVHHMGGSVDYLIVHYSPILDKEGRPYKVLGIASNITETKVLEKSLHSKQEILSETEFNFNQFKNLIDEGFMHCELSPLGDLLDVNNNYAEASGYHRQELIGKDCRIFLKQDELKQFDLIWMEVHKDKSYKGVIKRTKPTGDEFWLLSCFVPFKDSTGIIQRIHFFAMDVTEKKLKYQVLEDANKEIDRLKGLIV